MSDPDFAKFVELNAQLARSNGRVTNFVERLIDRVDALVAASLDSDWDEVRRQSEFLATSGQVYGLTEIANSARRVCQSLNEKAAPVEVKRRLVKLIGACGTARPPSRRPE